MKNRIYLHCTKVGMKVKGGWFSVLVFRVRVGADLIYIVSVMSLSLHRLTPFQRSYLFCDKFISTQVVIVWTFVSCFWVLMIPLYFITKLLMAVIIFLPSCTLFTLSVYSENRPCDRGWCIQLPFSLLYHSP